MDLSVNNDASVRPRYSDLFQLLQERFEDLSACSIRPSGIVVGENLLGKLFVDLV